MMDVEIKCPKCSWEPEASSRWSCTCGHSWNTFDTIGRCPSCSKQWHDTQCLSCAQWSPHLEWYHNLDEITSKMIEEALQEATVLQSAWSHLGSS